MKYCVLMFFGFATAAVAGASAKIIDLDAYRRQRSCAEILVQEILPESVAEKEGRPIPQVFMAVDEVIQRLKPRYRSSVGAKLEKVKLNYRVASREGELKYRLMDFVNSWETIDPFEMMVKDALKNLIVRHFQPGTVDADGSRFIEVLQGQLDGEF